MKEYKAYKSAIVSQNRIIKEGKKYKGNIIETEKTAHFLHSRKGEVTVFEYRAVIEYINDKPIGILIISLVGDPVQIENATEHLKGQVAKLEVIRHG